MIIVRKLEIKEGFFKKVILEMRSEVWGVLRMIWKGILGRSSSKGFEELVGKFEEEKGG